MSKTIVVQDKFRTNELSIQPGGSTVTVSHSDGSHRVYKNIKNPKAYTNSAVKDETVVEVQVDGQPYWSR